MRLSVSASITLIHAGTLPDLRQETYVAPPEEKKLFIRGLQNEMSSGRVSNNEVVLYKFLIHQHFKSIMRKLKNPPTQK